MNTVRGIKREINALQYNPKRHELDEDLILSDFGIRKHYYKDYKIYYIIDEDTKEVIVSRILHMLVDSRNWLYRTFEIEK